MAKPARIAVDPPPSSAARKRSRVRRAFSTAGLLILDAGFSMLALIIAFKFRHQSATLFIWPHNGHFPLDVSVEFAPYFNLLLAAPFVKILALQRLGLYKLRGEFSFSGDFVKLFKATTLSFLLLVLFAFLVRQGFSFKAGKIEYYDFSYSRLVFVSDWLLSLFFFCIVRYAVRILQILYRHNGRNMIPTVVVGCGEMAQVCIAEMSEKPRLGYKLVGVITAQPDEDITAIESYNVNLLGSFNCLPELVNKYGIEEVLITETSINPRTMFEVLMECGRDHEMKYRVIPNLFDCLPGKTEIATIGSLPMIKLFEEPLRGPKRALKRSTDIIVASLLMLLTSPFWLIIAILIKLESKGPVFYRQERVGMDGKVFLMVKFRSMRFLSDESSHKDVMKKMIQGDDANQGTSEEPVYGKVKDDPRLTNIGSWLRRYSVDELPQVINVLKGEMSMVGPRPPIPYEVRCYMDWHRARFHVKPGLTGLWQVSGRNKLHFEEMVRLDVFYIENWSLWLDIKILLKTIPVVLRGDNMY